MVTLISAMLPVTKRFRLVHLTNLPDPIGGRWRARWRSTFTNRPFPAVARAAVATPLAIATSPVSLLDRLWRHRAGAYRLPPVPGSADRRCIGGARFLMGGANLRRMRVADPQ